MYDSREWWDGTIDEVKKALKSLGVSANTSVSVTNIGFNRVRVDIDGEQFGIYDINRRTFVD